MNEDPRQWPRIYLTYCDGSYEQPVLWCQDRVDDSDVEYVNIAAFRAQTKHIAELEAEVARLVVCVEQWRRFNNTLIDTWDDDEDYDEEGVCDD